MPPRASATAGSPRLASHHLLFATGVNGWAPAVKCNGCFAASRLSRPQLRHRGHRVGIAGQEPAAVGLFAIYRDTMTGELLRFSAGGRGHRKRVTALRVTDFGD